jgi:hypothetical protein
MKVYIKLIITKFRLMGLLMFPCKNRIDFLVKSLCSVALTWRNEFQPICTYLAMFDVLRQRNFQGNLLELGGGFSTIIAANVFDSSIISYTSVDVNPNKYVEIFNSTSDAKSFLRSIKHIDVITVNLEDVYGGIDSLKFQLQSFNRPELKSALSKFVNDRALVNKLCDLINSDNSSLKEYLQAQDSFKDDLNFYNAIDENSETFANLSRGRIYDAIFFDCGEVSSIGEWFKFSNSIPIDGYALFHDIFYPKSIKNFLICTFLDLSNDWEIIYKDEISSQGGLVAIRLA